MPQQIVTSCQIWKLKCISRNAFSFQGLSCIIWLINKMSNKLSKLHFHFLLQDCSLCHTTEKETRGHCFFFSSPPPAKKCSKIQPEFAIPSGAGEWRQRSLFSFSPESDRPRYASNVSECGGVHIRRWSKRRNKRRVWRLLVAETVVHVVRNSREITTVSSSVLRSSQPWFAFFPVRKCSNIYGDCNETALKSCW